MTSSPYRPALDRAAGMAWRLIVVVAAAAAVVWLLARLRLVVLPVIVAFLLTTVLRPPAAALQRRGVHRMVATWAVLLGFFGILAGLMTLIVPAVGDQFGELGPKLEDAEVEVKDWLATGPFGLSEADAERLVDDFRTSVTSREAGSLRAGIISGAVLVGEIVAGILLAIVLTFFFVKDGDNMNRFFLRHVPPHRRDVAREMGAKAWSAAGGYVKGSAIVGVADAALIGIGLLIIGVPLVLPLVIITFFAAFFPIVGAVVAGAIAALVALVSNGFTDALLVVGVTVVVQQVEGDVLGPLVLGRAVKLHPVVILIALTAGGVLAGIVGAFLAVPVTAVAVAVGGVLREGGLIGVPPDADPVGEDEDEAGSGDSPAG